MALNPVEQSLVLLCNHWNKFRAAPDKRFLVWQIPDNASRILQCFFEAQKHEAEYSTNDLFIVFSASFENAIQYSRALKEELAGQYTASIDDLKQQGIETDWAFLPENYVDSANGFMESLRSLGSKYHKTIGHLVAVFMPRQVTDYNAYTAWLIRALDNKLPDRLRMVVMDSIEHPNLNRLTELNNSYVAIDSPKIDTFAIAQETFAQEKTFGPAGIFRNYLMGLVTLIEKGSLDQVKTKAVDAFAFARKQNWSDQEVVVRMLYAGALLKNKQFDQAIKTYQGARQSALKSVESKHPSGLQLVLQTWFGEASAFFAAGNIQSAAACYDRAATVADQIPNLILEIEAYRMGVFCCGQLDQKDAALERGAKVFDCALRLKPEARAMTTMPLAALDMLRVIDPERMRQMEEIKFHHEERIAQIKEGFEQHVQALDKTSDNQQLCAVEEKLTAEIAQAEKDTSIAINEVASSGTEAFRNIFLKARSLLNVKWPLTTLVAVSPSGEESAS